MSAEYVRRYYDVDFKRGDRVIFDGQPGVVVSFPDAYIGVRLDGDKHTSRCHPTWRLARPATETREQAENVHAPALTVPGFTAALRALGRDGGESRG